MILTQDGARIVDFGLAAEYPRFADTFSLCWKFGQAQQPAHAARFDALRQALASRRARRR